MFKSYKSRRLVHLSDVGEQSEREEKCLRRKLYMVEDFLANISIRTQQVIDDCKSNDENYSFPSITADFDQLNFSTYQNALFNIEVIHQYICFILEDAKKLRDEKASVQVKLDEALQAKHKVEEYYGNVMAENVDITKKLKKLQRTNTNLEVNSKKLEEKLNRDVLQLKTLEVRNTELEEENEELLNKVQNFEKDFDEVNKLYTKNKHLQNLVQKLKTTVKKKSEELSTRTEENEELKQTIDYLETNTCHCRIPIDTDGIIEENKRLWDAYNHLQMEYISCESEKDKYKKKIEDAHQKSKQSKEEIKSNLKHSILTRSKEKLQQEMLHLKEPYNKESRRISASNLKKSILTHSREKLIKHTEDVESLKDKITQLVSYIDENDNHSKKKDLDYNNLEEKLLNTEDMLLEYKESSRQLEELLDEKREEYERKLSVLTEALEQESEVNHILKNLLSNSLINALVDVHVKMKEYEELLCEDFDTSDAVCLDLLQKIEDLREICEDEIVKIVDAVDDELREYKTAILEMEKVDNVEEFPMVVNEIVF